MRVKRESERKEAGDEPEQREPTERKDEVARVKIEPWRPPERTTARKTTSSSRPPPHAYITLDDDEHDDEKEELKEKAVQKKQPQSTEARPRTGASNERKATSENERKESESEESRKEEEQEDRRRALKAEEQRRTQKLRQMKEQEVRRRDGREAKDSDSHKRPAATAATASRGEPPRARRPVDLSKMSKTEKREYLQQLSKSRAVQRDGSDDRMKEKVVPTRKRMADGKLKSSQRTEREGKRRAQNSKEEESADDEEEEEYGGDVEDGARPTSPRRTRGSRSATAPISDTPGAKSKEERAVEKIHEGLHALPASFASVRGGEDKGEKSDLCCVCFYGYGFGDPDAPEDEQDGILLCTSCGMNVHESCYGVSASKIPDDFVCKLCQSNVQMQVRCALCRQVNADALRGAFKPVQEESRLRRDRGAWAHIACALWVPGCGFAAVGDDVRAEVTGIDYLSDELYNKSSTCALCTNREGVKMKCFNTNCEIHFHPLCGLRHEWIEDFFYWKDGVDGADGEYVTHQDYEYVDDIKIHKPYCKWHDPSDRHGLRSREQQRKTREEEEEEARQAVEVRRRAEARKKQRLEQSVVERALRLQDKMLVEEEETNQEGKRREKKHEEAETMADQSRKALQKIREQQTLTVHNGTSVKPERSPSPAKATSPLVDSLAVGREKARVLLTEQVGKKRATEIEEELYRIHPPDVDPTLPVSQLPLVLSAAYKLKLQSVLANLRHNEQLCEDVLEKSITAAQLVAMDERSMADEGLKAAREQAKAEDTEERIRRNEVRTVRRMDGAIVQLREETLEEVKGDEGDDSMMMADGGDDGAKEASGKDEVVGSADAGDIS